MLLIINAKIFSIAWFCVVYNFVYSICNEKKYCNFAVVTIHKTNIMKFNNAIVLPKNLSFQLGNHRGKDIIWIIFTYDKTTIFLWKMSWKLVGGNTENIKQRGGFRFFWLQPYIQFQNKSTAFLKSLTYKVFSMLTP